MPMQPLVDFLDQPRVEGLDTIPSDEMFDQDYLLRVGILFGLGLITAGEARLLLASRSFPSLFLLDALPDRWRARIQDRVDDPPPVECARQPETDPADREETTP